MTPEELEQSLDELGWSKGKLAKLIDVTPTTVSRWITGKQIIPGYVKFCVELALGIKRIVV